MFHSFVADESRSAAGPEIGILIGMGGLGSCGDRGAVTVSGRSEVLPTGIMSSALWSCRPLRIRNSVHSYTEFIRALIASMHIDGERSPVLADLIQVVTAEADDA